jgi:hypothetical protein
MRSYKILQVNLCAPLSEIIENTGSNPVGTTIKQFQVMTYFVYPSIFSYCFFRSDRWSNNKVIDKGGIFSNINNKSKPRISHLK